jgi:hypothetical protein
MSPRFWTAIALGAGIALGAIGDNLLRPPSPARPVASAISADPGEGDDEDSLAAANANLVGSLQECNRRLASAGQPRVVAPSPAAGPSASGRSRDQRRADAKVRLDGLAQQGVISYNIPCIRDTPFVPSQRQLDRLGLAPHDADALRDAYAKSNQRAMAQIKPLCARVLGNEALVDRVGPSACMSAIVDGARKENADKMQEALVRVGEVNAGKRAVPKSGEPLEPVEALLLGFSAESKAFEADLAASLGPDDAHRIASSRALCSERGTVRAKTDQRD